MLDSKPSATFLSNSPLTASFTKETLEAAVARSPAATAVSASAIAETTVSKVAASASFARKGSGRTKPTDRIWLATSFICAMLSWIVATSQVSPTAAMGATGAATFATGGVTCATGVAGSAVVPGTAHADSSVLVWSAKSARSKSMLDSNPSATFPSNSPLTASFTKETLDAAVSKSPAAAAVPASAIAETTVSKVAASRSFARKGSGRTKPTDRILLATSFICARFACTAVALQPPATAARVNFSPGIGAVRSGFSLNCKIWMVFANLQRRWTRTRQRRGR
ncbi:hypothetical protein FB451DRAFT_1236220 [Mycena latifolia]|nr:hypothetical protein FB451DRAFT_1236220 [Mycena latifolia]